MQVKTNTEMLYNSYLQLTDVKKRLSDECAKLYHEYCMVTNTLQSARYRIAVLEKKLIGGNYEKQ